MEVLLVQPPYLRLVGSHNDRVPLELCYLRTYLDRAGIDSLVFNADWTGATKYIKWRRLFTNSRYLEAAADGDSPLYDETLERIFSYAPQAVVLSAADGLTPWVDLGNAYVTAELSRRLRHYGLYTLGVGPFYSRVPRKFLSAFDAILVGAASPSVVEALREKPRGAIVRGVPMDLRCVPHVDDVEPGGGGDVVMTAIGCPYRCSFCLARDSKYEKIATDAVVQDIENRAGTWIDFGDSIFPLDIPRLQHLAKLLTGIDKIFSCEVSARTISERSLEALCAIGVEAVKLGFESADEDQLRRMRKNQTPDDCRRAVDLCHRFGLHVTAYVLLGGPGVPRAAAAATLDQCRKLGADDFVVNVWSYHDLERRDFRYDAHFSQRLAEAWGIESILPKLFDLQRDDKAGLGPLI